MGRRKTGRGRGRPAKAGADVARKTLGRVITRSRRKGNGNSGDGGATVEIDGGETHQRRQMLSGPGQLEISSTPQANQQQLPVTMTGEVVSASATARSSIDSNIDANNATDSGNGGTMAVVPTESFPCIVPQLDTLGLDPVAGFSSPYASHANRTVGSPINTDVGPSLVRTGKDGSSQPATVAGDTGVGPPQKAKNMNLEGPPSINPSQLHGETLGTMVSQGIKEKIWRGEYVDFNGLVGDQGVSTRPVGPQGDQLGFTMVQAGHQLVLKPVATRNKITNIEAWTNAFLVYASVYLQAHGNQAQALLKYCSLIRSASNRYTGYGWRDYDIQFRSRITQIDQAWEKIDGELWLMYVVGGGSPRLGGLNPMNSSRHALPGKSVYSTPSSSPFPRQQAGGWRQNSGQRPGGRPASSPRTPGTSGVCYELNFGPGTCNRQQCRFLHKCVACGNVGHGKVKCPKIRQAKGSQNPK